MFQGLILHSAEYKDASQWKGKRGVVIGTANTGNFLLSFQSRELTYLIGHDVADDMVEAGLSSVTMIQRGKTCT
jgi:hypothetical protein